MTASNEVGVVGGPSQPGQSGLPPPHSVAEVVVNVLDVNDFQPAITFESAENDKIDIAEGVI